MSADDYERGYEDGPRTANLIALRTLLRAIGHDANEPDGVKLARLVVVYEETRLKLRDVCAVFGDNDWPDDLHLGDVVDKHLANHLHARKDADGSR